MDTRDETRTEGGGLPGVGTDAETERFVRALSNPWRRAVLAVLAEEPDGELQFETLVTAVLERNEESVRVPHLSGDDRDAVELGFHHVHLPKLESADVVEYDRDSMTVRYRPDERVERVLTTLDALDADQ